MKYSLSSGNIDISDTDRELLDKKLGRLDKILRPPYVTDVRLVRGNHRHKGRVVTCVINIEQGKKVFHAERSESSIQDALDEALEALQNELKKDYGKRQTR